MKKILFISALPPSNKTAGCYYTLRSLDDLVNNDYTVDLIYFDSNIIDAMIPEKVNVLKKYPVKNISCIKNLPMYPLFTRRFEKHICNYIRSISQNYDVLYFDYSQTFLYSCHINHKFKILRCHDVIAQRYTRVNPILSGWVKYGEKKILQSGNLLLTPSNKDCDLIKNLYDLPSVSTNEYLKKNTVNYCSDFEIMKNSFCFYGAWSRMDNWEALVWFLKYVHPKLSENFSFCVLGGGLDDKKKKYISKFKNVKFTGFIDDILKEITKYQAVIAPLFHGAGIKVKVIDALTTGTPVIGTDIAFEGIESMNELCLFANDVSDFIKTLNNWQSIDILYKKSAKEKFIAEYDKNHISDLLKNEKLWGSNILSA